MARAVAGQRKQLGHDPPRLAGLLAHLSVDLLKHRQYSEAEVYLRECLAILENKDPDARETFNAKSRLGGALLGQQKYADAEPMLLEGYQGMKARATSRTTAGSPFGQRLTEALERLVQLYDGWGKLDEAAKLS